MTGAKSCPSSHATAAGNRAKSFFGRDARGDTAVFGTQVTPVLLAPKLNVGILHHMGDMLALLAPSFQEKSEMDFTRSACGFGSLALCIALVGDACMAADKSAVSVAVTKAIALTPKEAGGKTVEVHAVISIKNEGDQVIAVSPRQFGYELRKKQADGTLDEPVRFFGIADPEIKDAQPLGPGQSVKLEAELQAHTDGVEVGPKYLLIVTNPNNDNAKQQVEVTFK